MSSVDATTAAGENRLIVTLLQEISTALTENLQRQSERIANIEARLPAVAQSPQNGAGIATGIAAVRDEDGIAAVRDEAGIAAVRDETVVPEATLFGPQDDFIQEIDSINQINQSDNLANSVQDRPTLHQTPLPSRPFTRIHPHSRLVLVR
jgi:hypothetical protein